LTIGEHTLTPLAPVLLDTSRASSTDRLQQHDRDRIRI